MKKNKILIVEDERTIIQQVDSLLESFGYESDFIPKADFLQKKLDSGDFCLILMDINMPGTDGISALTSLKKNPRFQTIPVIMMTADQSEKTLEDCFKAGADDYITKPVQELVLKARIKSVIEKQQHLAEIKLYILEIEKQRKNTMDSINYAKTIQEAMLPKQDILNSLFADAFIYYKPRDIVSGDFYMVKKLNNHIIILAADCTGHGVPGALLSMLGMSLINEIIRKTEDARANDILFQIREYINITFSHNNENVNVTDGMDASLLIIDCDTLHAQFAGANNPMVWFKNSDNENIIEIPADPVSIDSFYQDICFTNHEFLLEKKDVFYLFSDGYADQLGGETNRKLKKHGFYTILKDIQNLSFPEQLHILNEKHNCWRQQNKQTDDILILGVML